ncbi:putative peptidase s8 and s53 protein [Phaeoacremonium minimum UCRPA7]|uniref:Putative peptidase s8 and s53 protein n=1 Tax=Phaeoacremonium minimum (strain UCR-PA7) TaxID=1286976 RepID=R8BGR2_PHAM7|nr:putative peptidase s8 and s53 protein [Phaeoacremonium minimum UCRPA7]EON98530.1 putative peptidase s8 and s53 protein [Phaeoacremonium minimum UCRPA7]
MSTEPPPDAVLVKLNGQVQDPRETYAKDAKYTDFIVITVYNVLSIPQEEELEKLSVNILEDLGKNNFLCEYCLSDLTVLRKLDFVRQVDVYRNKVKIPATLEAASLEIANTTIATANTASVLHDQTQLTVDIFTHETVKDEEFEALKLVVAEASGVPVNKMEFAPGQVRLSVEPDKLADIAKDPKIRIIEEVLEPVLMSFESPITGSGVQESSVTNKALYGGKGQIITVTDTGFDRGSQDECHPAFIGKVHSLRSVIRKGDPKLSEQQKTDDPHGHGTHVSGILLGSHFNTTKGLIGGIAPEARLIVQSLFKDINYPIVLPIDLRDILAVPYDQGSRILSNSWGRGLTQDLKQPEYGGSSKLIDDFIRETPEVLICFSAGNDNLKGHGRPAIGLDAGSKNVLTIGATGNRNSPDQMFNQSSLGPTKEGRLKPDVVAPGIDIYAPLSGGVPKFYGDTATSEDVPGVKWRPWSGTSQATPLVAGCAAILREVLQERGCLNPPGALLKALIINGAEKLPKLDVNAQGHGRVNLEASTTMIVRPPAQSKETTPDIPLPISGGSLIGDALKQDETYDFILSAPDSAESHSHFKITLVYNDIGNKQIQNNLNLFVTDMITDEVIPGNSRSLTEPDEQNNVEQIILGYIPKGGLKVSVHAQKILAKKDQDFVLAWSAFTSLPGVVF